MDDFPATLSAALHQSVSPAGETELEREVSRLFEHVWVPLCRYLAGVVGVGDAEDVAQESFLRYYRERFTGHEVDNARAWLFRVGHNLAVDRIRQAMPPEMPDFFGPATAELSVLEMERKERLRCGLRLLSPQERACLDLRCEGMRYREIAQTLGLKVPTVVTCITRAVTKLKKVLP